MQQSVSVLLISYNHEKLIAEAIKSVFIQNANWNASQELRLKPLQKPFNLC